MRKCLVCGESKEDELFVSRIKCKACKRLVDKKWEQENKEKIRLRKLKDRVENPEKYILRSKNQYEKNKVKVLEQTKARRSIDKKYLEVSKEYYKRNKSEILEKAKIVRAKKRKELGLPKGRVYAKNRFYIAESGDYLVIGITHDKTRRMKENEKALSLINMPFKPLFFFDCNNDKLIRKIETLVKREFCDINSRIDGFKSETCYKKHLDSIYLLAKNEFEKENVEYQIIKK